MTSKQLVPKGKKSGDRQLAPQNDYLARMNEMFLVPSRSDKQFKSPLVHVADVLRAGGFTGVNLRAALLTMVILNSARLNRRMAEFLVCRELSIPRTIISQCLEMIPTGSLQGKHHPRTQISSFPFRPDERTGPRQQGSRGVQESHQRSHQHYRTRIHNSAGRGEIIIRK